MKDPRVSEMAGSLIGSEILRIAAEVRALMAAGAEVCNLTVGDFDPAQFPIPRSLAAGIAEALRAGETNYPPSDGMLALRQSVVDLYRRRFGLEYPLESVLVTGGSRPGIYSAYRAVVDPGDTVVYPVPSWNNNHYVHLTGARGRPVACDASTFFLPVRAELEDAVRGARLLVLNSPLNPTGTAFEAGALAGICDLVLEENARRGPGERPLYLLYDQVYWMLTFGGAQHVNPVTLRPAMAEYTLFVDGASKAFASTGLRVGWTVAPADVSRRMASIVGHVGAWAPRAEQVAVARFLADDALMAEYLAEMNAAVHGRLQTLYDGFQAMRARGLPVDAIAPAGAIYLSARLALAGRRTPAGGTLQTDNDIRQYLLESAGAAIVPFQSFGFQEDTGWFRLSVGAASPEAIGTVLVRIEQAIAALN
ncbi:MAG: Aspartate aminotransferase [uncultured Gemmatimonadetes bacterium]|uniref:Aspartate aminotransferase n=1 Tax=uncultured Gemmatimonadota bacterium TaxID=203437 RepID=A0A6J4LFR0_9BACT|nr:MAG: Aspartate aminotransferase [uncultured Gemmatimonadota bacterium]